MTKHKKSGRECGFCHEVTDPAHNARSCPKRKATVGASAAPTAAHNSNSNGSDGVGARALSSPMPSVPTLLAPVTSSEFEEARKQVIINGMTITISMREYAAGYSNVVVRLQGDEGPKEFGLDIDQARRLFESLGWGLQRYAAKRLARPIPVAKPTTTTANGVKTHTEPSTPTPEALPA